MEIKNLKELCSFLNSVKEDYENLFFLERDEISEEEYFKKKGVVLDSLPVFGADIDDTRDIWSWDDENLLIMDDDANALNFFKVVSKADWYNYEYEDEE